jgi:nucleoside-diphosphate-sugar epimerase
MRVLITGGAGIIGCNLAAAYVRAGEQVTVLDDLSRRGSESNLSWLEQEFRKGTFRSARVTRGTAMLRRPPRWERR